jgi:hypothetical protein
MSIDDKSTPKGLSVVPVSIETVHPPIEAVKLSGVEPLMVVEAPPEMSSISAWACARGVKIKAVATITTPIVIFAVILSPLSPLVFILSSFYQAAGFYGFPACI